MYVMRVENFGLEYLSCLYSDFSASVSWNFVHQSQSAFKGLVVVGIAEGSCNIGSLVNHLQFLLTFAQEWLENKQYVKSAVLNGKFMDQISDFELINSLFKSLVSCCSILQSGRFLRLCL